MQSNMWGALYEWTVGRVCVVCYMVGGRVNSCQGIPTILQLYLQIGTVLLLLLLLLLFANGGLV